METSNALLRENIYVEKNYPERELACTLVLSLEIVGYFDFFKSTSVILNLSDHVFFFSFAWVI